MMCPWSLDPCRMGCEVRPGCESTMNCLYRDDNEAMIAHWDWTSPTTVDETQPRKAQEGDI